MATHVYLANDLRLFNIVRLIDHTSNGFLETAEKSHYYKHANVDL